MEHARHRRRRGPGSRRGGSDGRRRGAAPRRDRPGRLRRYRLGRVRQEMAVRGVDACVLVDPVSIRYACGSRNMQVFHLRNPARYLVVPVEGPVVLFEFTGCAHLTAGLETIGEVRPALTASYVAAGDGIGGAEWAWARQVGDAVREHCGAAATVGVERVNAGAAAALAGLGFRLVDAQGSLERARAVKSPEEVACIRRSLAATAIGMDALRAGLVPGRPRTRCGPASTRRSSPSAATTSRPDCCPRVPAPTPGSRRPASAASKRTTSSPSTATRSAATATLRLVTDLPRRGGRPLRRAARAVPGRAGAGRAQPGPAPARGLLPRLRPGRLAHPGALPRQPVLPVGPRVAG